MGYPGNVPETSWDKSRRLIKYAKSVCYHKQKYADEVIVNGETISQKCQADRECQ